MFVAYILKNFLTDFGEHFYFLEIVLKDQKNLESSLYYVKKYSKTVYVQYSTWGFPISVELVHKTKHTDINGSIKLYVIVKIVYLISVWTVVIAFCFLVTLLLHA